MSVCSASVCTENKALFWFSRHISLWGSISFYLACLVNIAVAVFYPFGDDGDEGEDFYFSDTKIYLLIELMSPGCECSIKDKTERLIRLHSSEKCIGGILECIHLRS